MAAQGDSAGVFAASAGRVSSSSSTSSSIIPAAGYRLFRHRNAAAAPPPPQPPPPQPPPTVSAVVVQLESRESTPPEQQQAPVSEASSPDRFSVERSSTSGRPALRPSLRRVANCIQARLGWPANATSPPPPQGLPLQAPPAPRAPSAPPNPPTYKMEDTFKSGVWARRWTVDPAQPGHYRWLLVVTIAVLYNLVFVIGRAVFWELNNLSPALWWFLDYFCDFVYLVDVLVHMHEGYLEQGLLVEDAKLLRQNYLKGWAWRWDLASLLPTDLAYLVWPTSGCHIRVPCPVIVRANRLLRAPRMLEFFDRTETRTGYPNCFRICKVVLAILVLIHWNACAYFAISYVVGFGSDNWVYNLNGTLNGTLSRQYIYSFYWSTLTLTTIGETPQPENDVEYLFVVVDFLAGVLIFATIVGNIGSMISNMNTARVEFQNRMDGVKQYMAFRRVSKELEARVIRWFAYTWANKQALDEERVLAALPDRLKTDIALHVHLDTLNQVEIFKGCEQGLREELVLKLRLQVFSPGDYICRKGDVGRELYIVKRGSLSVVNDDGSVVLARLGPGSVFGEVSVLEIAGNSTGNRRTATVRSLGYSDVFCLSKNDLWATLADYPEARQSLLERGCHLLRKDGLLDEAAYQRAQAEHETLTERVQRLDAAVEDLQARLARAIAELGGQHSRLRQRVSRVERVGSSRGSGSTLAPSEGPSRKLDQSTHSSVVERVTSRRSFQGPPRGRNAATASLAAGVAATATAAGGIFGGTTAASTSGGSMPVGLNRRKLNSV